jgi:hypothetical protein
VAGTGRRLGERMLPARGATACDALVTKRDVEGRPVLGLVMAKAAAPGDGVEARRGAGVGHGERREFRERKRGGVEFAQVTAGVPRLRHGCLPQGKTTTNSSSCQTKPVNREVRVGRPQRIQWGSPARRQRHPRRSGTRSWSATGSRLRPT